MSPKKNLIVGTKININDVRKINIPIFTNKKLFDTNSNSKRSKV